MARGPYQLKQKGAYQPKQSKLGIEDYLIRIKRHSLKTLEKRILGKEMGGGFLGYNTPEKRYDVISMLINILENPYKDKPNKPYDILKALAFRDKAMGYYQKLGMPDYAEKFKVELKPTNKKRGISRARNPTGVGEVHNPVRDLGILLQRIDEGNPFKTQHF